MSSQRPFFLLIFSIFFLLIAYYWPNLTESFVVDRSLEDRIMADLKNENQALREQLSSLKKRLDTIAVSE